MHQKGVTSLASRHHSLDLSELADVMDIVRAFEEHNSAQTFFRFNVGMVGKRPELFLTAACWGKDQETTVVPSSASVSVKCSDLNLKTWNAALTHVLYALDFQLALNEFESVERKRA